MPDTPDTTPPSTPVDANQIPNTDPSQALGQYSNTTFNTGSNSAPDTSALSVNATNNTNYVLRLYKSGSTGGVTQYIGNSSVTTSLQVLVEVPEMFHLQLNNRWVSLLSILRNIASSVFGSGSGPGNAAAVISGTVAGVQALTGTYLVPEISTFQVWQGTGPLMFNLPLIFNAIVDPATDVQAPIKALIQMFSPIRNGALLHAPGPVLSDVLLTGNVSLSGNVGTNGVGNVLSLRIGNAIHIPALIPTTLDINYHNRFNSAGLPIFAEVNVGLMTVFTPDQAEILGYFT